MKEVVEVLAKALVEKPEEVSVVMVENEKSCLIELKVAAEDMGKVIGEQGRCLLYTSLRCFWNFIRSQFRSFYRHVENTCGYYGGIIRCINSGSLRYKF